MTLHIEVSGQGPDIVLLHGWGAGAGAWNDVARQLAPKFRVHNVNLPGYGTSTAVLCSVYLERHSQCVGCGVARPTAVCGWSLGGHLAMEWALDAPAQVERLVLVASTPRFCRAHDWTCAMEASVIDSFGEHVVKDSHNALRRFVLLETRGDTESRTIARCLRALTDKPPISLRPKH